VVVAVSGEVTKRGLDAHRIPLSGNYAATAKARLPAAAPQVPERREMARVSQRPGGPDFP